MLKQLTSNKLYIYGMGEYGIDICLRLRDVGITVHSFIDGSAFKWERQIYGIPCCSLTTIAPTEDIVIIAGLRDSSAVVEMLHASGYKNVYTYQEVWQTLKTEGFTEQQENCEIDEIKYCKQFLEEMNAIENVEWKSKILKDVYAEICRQRYI